MMPISVGEAAAVLGAARSGDLDLNTLLTSATADSRAVVAGSLFVALAGDHADGHDHAAAAVRSGAAAALTARPVGSVPCLVVADPLVAFGRLARHLVDLADAGGLQVVGVTGSAGKTSTKDLMAQILEAAGPTVAPVGNLNNELGVPLTITRVDPGTRFLVAELGARGIGHIGYLCEIAHPRVGVVLNVGQAHVGEFGGRDAIAQAKGELPEALPPHGWAVLNADDPLVWAMRTRTSARVVAFSAEAEPNAPDAVWASGLEPDAAGRYRFRLTARLGDRARSEVEVQLQVTGRHQVPNAVAAAAAAYALGVPLDVVGTALSAATARSRWRMELTTRADSVTVVNDAYNANPDSVRAAIDTLSELGRARGARTWAVLGDMLELGDSAVAEHQAIGAYAAAKGIDRLVTVGAYASTMADAAVAAGMNAAAGVRVAPDKSAAGALVAAELDQGDVVLVKASRGLALDTVADDLLAAVPAASPDRVAAPGLPGAGG